MTNADHDLDPVTLEVYDLFRRQPGDAFSVDAIAEQVGYDEDEVTAGLSHLVEAGLVLEQGSTDTTTYILSTAAPEL